MPISHNDAMTFDVARKAINDGAKERTAKKFQDNAQQAIYDTLRDAGEPLSINSLDRRIDGITAHKLKAPLAAMVAAETVIEVERWERTA